MATDVDLHISLAEPHDSAAVRSCVRAAYARYVERIEHEPGPMSADYDDLIARGAVYLLRPRGSEEIYGVLVLQTDSHALQIENVAIAPEYQHRGYGRELLRFAEQRARDIGLLEVSLYTNELMTENIQLYRRLGYVEVDRRLDEGFRRVFMSKRMDSL